MKTAIVTAADANYVPFLTDLLDSLDRHQRLSNRLDVCLLDVGLTPEQRSALGKRVTAWAAADIRRFLDEAQSHPDCVICGCPVFDASIPKARYYGRYLTHGMVWLETLSLDIRDSMCGFRLYPLESTAPLLEPGRVGPRMDFDTEMIVKLHWREVPMRWIPTRVSYPMDGVSHFRMFFDNARMTSLHIRLTLGMLVRLPMLLWRRLAHRRAPEAQINNVLR